METPPSDSPSVPLLEPIPNSDAQPKPFQSKPFSWPQLKRIQILLLSVEAAQELFPEVANRPADKNEPPEPEPIIRHLSSQLHNSPDRSLPIRQFQSFIVGRKVYVIVESESVNGGRVSRGILTFSTSIITEGLPLEKLSSIHICLVRSFSKKEQPNFDRLSTQPTAAASQSSSSSSSRPFPFKGRLNFSQGGSHSPTHLPPGVTLPADSSSPLIPGPVIVSLKSVLQSYLHRYPCLVFSPGQQILLPLLPELKQLKYFHSSSEQQTQAAASSSQQPSSDSNQIASQSTLLNQVLSSQASSRSNQVSHQSSSQSTTQQSNQASSSSSPSEALLFFVYSTSSTIPGVILPEFTSISIELDPIGEFERLGVSPLIDTIPHAYQFDYFNDYIKPFVEANPFRLLCEGSLFSYHGVQFKVRHTKPSRKEEIDAPDAGQILWKSFRGTLGKSPANASIFISPTGSRLYEIEREWKDETKRLLYRTIIRRGCVCRRTGRTTRIYLSEPVAPQLRDILPTSVMDEVQRLPTRLQSIAAIHALADLSPQDLVRIFGFTVAEQEESQSERQLRQEVAKKVLTEFATIYRKPPSNKDENAADCDGDCVTDVANITNGAQKAEDPAEDGVCVVCISSVTFGEEILELPCGHIYHLSCVEEWLKRSFACPVCKRDLREFLPGAEKKTEDSGQSWWL